MSDTLLLLVNIGLGLKIIYLPPRSLPSSGDVPYLYTEYVIGMFMQMSKKIVMYSILKHFGKGIIYLKSTNTSIKNIVVAVNIMMIAIFLYGII